MAFHPVASIVTVGGAMSCNHDIKVTEDMICQCSLCKPEESISLFQKYFVLVALVALCLAGSLTWWCYEERQSWPRQEEAVGASATERPRGGKVRADSKTRYRAVVSTSSRSK